MFTEGFLKTAGMSGLKNVAKKGVDAAVAAGKAVGSAASKAADSTKGAVVKATGYKKKSPAPRNLGRAAATVTAVPAIAVGKAAGKGARAVKNTAHRLNEALKENRRQFVAGFNERAGIKPSKKKVQKTPKGKEEEKKPSFMARHPLLTAGAGLVAGKMMFERPEPETYPSITYPQ